MKKNKILLICTIIIAVILIVVGVCFGCGCFSKKSKEIKISLVDINKYDNDNIKAIKINDVVTDVEVCGYNLIGQLDDVLIVNTSHCESDYYDIYAFKNDGSYTIFSGKATTYDETKIALKGYYFNNATIEGNSLIITSKYQEILMQDQLCNNVDDVYGYTEKTTYKDGKFSDLEVVSSTTISEYLKKENITCTNNINVSLTDDKFIAINGKSTDVSALNYIIVGRVDDVVDVLTGNMDFTDVYLFKADGSYVRVTGNKINSNTSGKTYKLKGNYLSEDIKNTTDSFIFKSAIDVQDIQGAVCENPDDAIYEYEEKITYKNGSFSDLELVSSTTVKDYREKEKINCD